MWRADIAWREPPGRGRAWALAAATVALGLVIVALSGPRLMASLWLALQPGPTEQIYAGAAMTEADLQAVIASRRLALAWGQGSEVHADLAAAHLTLSERAEPDSEDERVLLVRAVDETEAGLALAPADPRGWLQLGYLRALLSGPQRTSAKALLLSIRTGPYDAPDFVQMRLHLALLHWGLLDGAEREQVESQVGALWSNAPLAVAELALDDDLLPLLVPALRGRPDAQQSLLDAVEQF